MISNSARAGPTFVTNNRVFNAGAKAISGHDRLAPAALGPNVYLQGNFPGIDSVDLPAEAIGGSMNYEPDTGAHKRYVADGWRKGWREL